MNSRKAWINSGPNIFGKQFGARLAIAMLAGERATEAHDEIRGLLDERAIVADAGRGFEIEVDARVQAAMTEVAVEGSGVVVLIEQSSQSLRRYSPIFSGGTAESSQPSQVKRLAGNEGGGTEAGFADLPDERLFALVVDRTSCWARSILFLRASIMRLALLLASSRDIATVLHKQEAGAFGQQCRGRGRASSSGGCRSRGCRRSLRGRSGRTP